MAASDLHTACEELLTTCQAALATTPYGAMTRAFVSPGSPAWDCPDQITVHAGGPAPADTAPLSPTLQPAHHIADGVLLNMMTLTITTLRCVPSPEQRGENLLLPPAQDIDAAAAVTLSDLWAIWNFAACRKRDLSLFPPKQRELIFDPAVSLHTSGGIAGWQIQMRVQLDGYKT